ncbi:DUF3784 domain-containing protein [Oscillospiraceae bacterium MB08-C2-2]|nr:DUF3784 domain-containing protein [Oscillospiraceae bacterium MB08-C2-2]
MNVGAAACLFMAGIFLLLAVIFALLKEKGAVLISGFNTLPKEQRLNYDQAKMSKDMRNSLIIWVTIFAVGAILCYFLSPYFAIASFAIWLVLFFKEVHSDPEKAFGKYRL